MARIRQELSLGRPALYLDAMRGMRLRQIVWRARRLIPLSALAWGTNVRRPPPPRLVAAGLGCSPAPQSGPTEPPHETGVFAGYGASRKFGDPRFWGDPGDGLLFLFHLHGFSPLTEYAAGSHSSRGDAFWAQVVADWLDAHDRPASPAWHPYPTSVRIISWSAALSSLDHWPSDLRERSAAAVLRQARYLKRAVEHDVGGNHVIKNATALAFAGALFPSSGLTQTALRLLKREIARQILADGGHEERSTSYHREVLADLQDVRTLLVRGDLRVPEWLASCLDSMDQWARSVAGPDGRLPLLNDAWDGPPVDDVETEARTVLEASGYVVLRHGADQLVFDAGPLCPSHLPPHAHADALGLVLWVDGAPLLVDPGSYTYANGRRDEFRGTRAHTTVEVDGQDQCVFFGPFRAAQLPEVTLLGVVQRDDLVIAAGSHTGYRRLREGVDHVRVVVWWPCHGVVVLDRLVGAGEHVVRSCLRCAPASVPSIGRLGPFRLERFGPTDGSIRESTVSPTFGVEHPALAVDMSGTVSAGETFGWSLLRPPAKAHIRPRDGELQLVGAGQTRRLCPFQLFGHR